jgi:hypothetical protein
MPRTSTLSGLSNASNFWVSDILLSFIIVTPYLTGGGLVLLIHGRIAPFRLMFFI